MIKLRFILTILFVSLSLSNCDKSDDNISKSCDKQVVISPNEFRTAPTDELTIERLEIVGNCLTIIYSSSGCDGDSWSLKLIDSGDILESFPAQRNLILSFKNEELCEVYLTKEVSFEIAKLQVEGNQVILNIVNTNDKILYEY